MIPNENSPVMSLEFPPMKLSIKTPRLVWAINCSSDLSPYAKETLDELPPLGFQPSLRP